MISRSLVIKILVVVLALALGIGLTYAWFAYRNVGAATIPLSVLKDLEPTVATPLAAEIPANVRKDLEPTKK